MFSPKLAILATLAAAVMLTGCGKKPANAVDATGGEIEERVVPHVPNTASSPTPGQTKAVGVYVDGRWYAKGSEPTAKATAAPAAPEPGLGHLHVSVGLKGMSGFTSTMVIKLVDAKDKTIASHTFTKDDLGGLTADYTFTNVGPGSYVMVRDDHSSSGGLFAETSFDVEVIADRTVDNDI